MQSVPTAYYQGCRQGSHTRHGSTEYSTSQHLQWMADIVYNKIIRQQVAQVSRYTEHHVYHHFVPTEPGASVNSHPFHTPRSLFSTPNWSNPSSVESSPELIPAPLETQRVIRIPVRCHRGAVSYNLPPPAYYSESAQTETASSNLIQTRPVQIQTERVDSQHQNAYGQAVHTHVHAEPAKLDRALTPIEFIEELQRLVIQGAGNQPFASRFLIQGEKTPVSVWRPDQNGPVLVQHYLPNGQEDAISVAHIMSGGGIVWSPPPNVQRC